MSLVRWVAVLVVVALASTRGARAANVTVETGTAFILVQHYDGKPEVRKVTVELDNGGVVIAELDEKMLAAGLRSGMRVNVTLETVLDTKSDGEQGGNATLPTTLAPGDQKVVSILPLEADAPDDSRSTAGRKMNVTIAGVGAASLKVTSYVPLQKSVRTLVIPILARNYKGERCPGVEPRTYSLQMLRDILFRSKKAAGRLTLADIYASCSLGKTTLASDSVVTDFVTIPCRGTTKFGAWNITGCDGDNLSSMTLVADSAMAQRKYDYNNFDSIVYLLPATTGCPWAGMGTWGCIGRGCKMWGNGKYWDQPLLYLHEQGHQSFLGHASAEVNGKMDEYGDGSCVMGACCGVRCHNTPHRWQMGWLELAEVTGSDLEAGTTITLDLIPHSDPDSRGVRIVPDWGPKGSQNIYLGFRDTRGAEVGLGSEYAFKTNIYQSAIRGQRDGVPTQWLGALHDGAPVYSIPSLDLTLRHVRGSNQGATISLCRSGGEETWGSCCAGIDWDCNGQAGKKDDACSKFDCANPPSDPQNKKKGNNSTEPEPSPSPSAAPKRSTVQSYVIRQHVYLTAASCDSWMTNRNKAAFGAAATELTQLTNLQLECQEAGADPDSPAARGLQLLRVAVLALTRRIELDAAKALADGFNRGVEDGSFARLVEKQSKDGAAWNVRAADGYCVVGFTDCPPKTPAAPAGAEEGAKQQQRQQQQQAAAQQEDAPPAPAPEEGSASAQPEQAASKSSLPQQQTANGTEALGDSATGQGPSSTANTTRQG